MLKDITIGQFFPGTSPIHKLDARTKIIATIAYIVAIFLCKTFMQFALLAVFLAVVVGVSKIKPKMLLKSLKPLMFIIGFTAIINLFFTNGATVYWHWKFLILTKEGIISAVKMVLRISFLVTGTSMLTYTTSPLELTDAIERLLKPLKVIHFPTHELAMMMTIALRFIPTLIEETEKIMNAQKARGADFESGNVLKRAKALIPILVPMFVSAFRRADELALAMECRCYNGGIGKTKMTVTSMKFQDTIGFVLMFMLIALIIVLGKMSWVI